MNNKNNMILAFILNFIFSIFEIISGTMFKSSSIFADGIHDFGDAASIGMSLFFQKISKKEEDKLYTYGYGRYNVIGAVINLIILFVGAIFIIIHSIPKIIKPEIINYDGMLLIAIIGVIINLITVIKTKNYNNISEKVINLHMLEDLIGWVTVLLAAILIKITNIYIIDPILSLLIALFILINVVKNTKVALDIILEKTPHNINIDVVRKEILKINRVINFYHIHIWTIDGVVNYLTAHIDVSKRLSKEQIKKLKKQIKNKLFDLNIEHTTLEIKTK